MKPNPTLRQTDRQTDRLSLSLSLCPIRKHKHTLSTDAFCP